MSDDPRAAVSTVSDVRALSAYVQDQIDIGQFKVVAGLRWDRFEIDVVDRIEVADGALTLTLAGIASISLAVAGILIMNVMLVAVSQRTAEVGLLKALGARRGQITALFLAEAILLSVAGAGVGLLLGYAANVGIGRLYPALPVGAPGWAVALAIVIAVASGVVFGLLPARRAARLDPVIALAGRR